MNIPNSLLCRFHNGFIAGDQNHRQILLQGQRRLAAIMFTDMVGYTALGQRNESLSLALLEQQRNRIRPVLKRHNGREVKTMGDAFLVEFASALDAVRCAYDIQRVMREFNISQPEEGRVQLRIGVHVGDVVEYEGDISGDAVNIASRIESLADDGGVCLTRQVHDHVQNKFERPLKSLGARQLKNVRAPLEVYKIQMPWEDARQEEPVELDRHRIAVLPLRNMSPDPNDEYFADGVTEELITALSSVSGLTVIARTSIMQYKNSTKRVSEMARELRTGTLIEGSVRKAANKVRITVQMVDARSEGHLWAQNYDRQMDDIFALQSEIAKKVVTALKVRLVDSQKRRLESRPTKNTEAYTLYLKGRYYWNERTRNGLNKAIGYFEESIERDPRFALGYAGLADSYFLLQANLESKLEGRYRKSKEYALKALSIDDHLAEPHATLAFIRQTEDNDIDGAEAEFKKSISLNPNYATAHQWYAHLLVLMGRIPEAKAEFRQALEIDPLSPIINMNIAAGLYYTGDLQATLKQQERVEEISPGFTYGGMGQLFFGLIRPLCRLGRIKEALRGVDEFSKTANLIHAKVMRAYVLAYSDKEMSRRLISEIEGEDADRVASSYIRGLASFIMGDRDAGFALLDQAFERQENDLFVTVDSELDQVRSDPRYLSFVRKLGLI